jgi:hypothetical protein
MTTIHAGLLEWNISVLSVWEDKRVSAAIKIIGLGNDARDRLEF